jgi:hypothetical protein
MSTIPTYFHIHLHTFLKITGEINESQIIEGPKMQGNRTIPGT